MDAEKFDKVVLDLLYDELDELTRASAIRHTEQSGRAKALYSELRATREVGALPLVEPPDDLEARILQAEERARKERPLRQRLGAFVSIAASYAMRPQVGMAAVLLLMVGSSLLFLRVKPGAPSSVQVTERGVPESDKESVTVPISPASPPTVAEEARVEQPTEARREGRARSSDAPKAEAARPAATVAENEPSMNAAPEAPGAAPLGDIAFDDAQGYAAPPPPPADGIVSGTAGPGALAGAAKDDEKPAGAQHGCDSDLPRYEAIMASPSASSPDALSAARFAAAQCYAILGRVDAARRSYTVLLKEPKYAEASRHALSILPEGNTRVAEASRRAASAPAKAAAPPAAAPPRAAAKPSQ